MDGDVLNCATVQQIIAEAANAGTTWNNLRADVQWHVQECAECAEVYYGHLTTWECWHVRSYAERFGVCTPAELPAGARRHLDSCDECDRMLRQSEQVGRMLSGAILSAQAIACPAFKPEMMRRPMTWKLAVALAVAAFALGLLALSMYRTAERWGWLYSPEPVPASHCADCPDCDDGKHQAAVK